MHNRLTGQTLAIATGHELSLALVADGMVLAERHVAESKGHAEALLPAIIDLVERHGGSAYRPDRIVVETGPGSFTGLRVGIAAARALGLGWDCPVLGIGSTMLVAAAARARGAGGWLHVALLAPRGQVWLQAHHMADLHSAGPAVALSVDEARAVVRDSPVTGSATAVLGRPLPLESVPRAAAVALLGYADLGLPDPLYVRVAA